MLNGYATVSWVFSPVSRRSSHAGRVIGRFDAATGRRAVFNPARPVFRHPRALLRHPRAIARHLRSVLLRRPRRLRNTAHRAVAHPLLTGGTPMLPVTRAAPLFIPPPIYYTERGEADLVVRRKRKLCAGNRPWYCENTAGGGCATLLRRTVGRSQFLGNGHNLAEALS